MSITNPTSDNLAQTAHALAGYGIALTAARFGTVPLLVVAGLFIAYAAIKEFWFDMHYETPEVSGGWERRSEGFFVLYGGPGRWIDFRIRDETAALNVSAARFARSCPRAEPGRIEQQAA